MDELAKLHIQLEETANELRGELHGLELFSLDNEVRAALAEISSAIGFGDAITIYRLWVRLCLLLLRVRSERLSAIYDDADARQFNIVRMNDEMQHQLRMLIENFCVQPALSSAEFKL